MKDISAGDQVKVLEIPTWLLLDLPEMEQWQLKAQKGQIVKVLKILPNGYVWLAFTDGTEGFSLQSTDVERA